MAIKSGEYVRRKSPEKVGSRELHVLAVDDSHVDRKVIERLLNISSCKVTLVESARRALQFLGLEGDKSSVGFDALKVNLIMTDYSMPGMTGYELLKKIKESSTLREIPVVIMSSENILARIDRCLEEGAEEFLVKPVKLSDVKRLTDFILNGEGKENGEGEKEERKLLDDCPKEYRVRENHKRKLLDDYIPPSSTSPRLSSSSTSTLAPDHISSPRPSLTPLTLQYPSKRQRL